MLNKKGFTLIELLIVITIIGILAVAFLPSLLGAPSKARDTQRIADVQKLAGMLVTQSINGTVTGGCVDDEADNDLGGTIKAADFGGKMINDPSDRGILAGNGTCKGYNVIANDQALGSQVYKFAVIGRVENPASAGNAQCPADVTSPQDINDWVVVPASVAVGEATDCYMVLVQ